MSGRAVIDMAVAVRKPVSAKGKSPAKSIRVMLVDDHPLWRETLRKVLEKKRFAVVVAEASDGMEAVAFARESDPELVIMDIQLPDKSGIEATRELIAERRGTKVLVLASSDKRPQVLEAIDAGACGYLLKTARSEEVLDAVRRVHGGELVFPAQLSEVLLDEFRQRGEGVAAPGGDQRSTTFRQEGDYWTVSYEGDVFRLRNTLGARYLAQLLRHPGREFHALDLVIGDRGAVGLGPAQEGEPVLDDQAKAAYRRKLEELKEELEEAERWSDIERASRAREEMVALTEQLSSAVGLGGRDRRSASTAERARVSVTLAIRATLAKISEYSPALSEHLTSTVKTGMYCSYAPDPRAQTIWR